MDLNNMGTKVLHNINAKNMTGHHDLRIRKFDRIIFNFPHAGFKGREEEMRVIKYVHSHSQFRLFLNLFNLLTFFHVV
jgi:25S rRNA (uracil2634-N3)-methyltransferase